MHLSEKISTEHQVVLFTGERETRDHVASLEAGVDVVVTMGCGDTCPYIPGKRHVDWPLEDPRGQSIVFVCRVRDDIRRRLTDLLAELGTAK